MLWGYKGKVFSLYYSVSGLHKRVFAVSKNINERLNEIEDDIALLKTHAYRTENDYKKWLGNLTSSIGGFREVYEKNDAYNVRRNGQLGDWLENVTNLLVQFNEQMTAISKKVEIKDVKKDIAVKTLSN